MREEEDDVGGGVEGEGGGEVSDLLVVETGGGGDLDGVEGGPGVVDAVERAEVGEFLEGGGLGLEISRLDLAPDLLQGLGDEGRLADELEPVALDQVL